MKKAIGCFFELIGIIVFLVVLVIALVYFLRFQPSKKTVKPIEKPKTSFSAAPTPSPSIKHDDSTYEPEEAAEEANPSPTPETEKTDMSVTPEFKEYMDSYEAFMNDYITFMEKADSDDASLSWLLEYASMMEEYADMEEQIDAIEEDELSNADYKYYIEVMARIANRMASVN